MFSRYLTVTVSQTPESFTELLRQIVQGAQSQVEVARAIGITPQRFSRALNKGDFPLSVENCLRLSRASGVPASRILRSAGKQDVATLLEELYGEPSTSIEERAHLRDWRALPAGARHEFTRLIRRLLYGEGASGPSPGTTRHVEETPATKPMARSRRAG
jgi:transcriptional regulator with XRE-family HTH domain